MYREDGILNDKGMADLLLQVFHRAVGLAFDSHPLILRLAPLLMKLYGKVTVLFLTEVNVFVNFLIFFDAQLPRAAGGAYWQI